MIEQLIKELNNLANPQKAKVYQRFFKTGRGEYGEGDRFLGLTVPQTRAISKKYFKLLSLSDIQKLLQSKIHEHRLSALMILRLQYEKSKLIEEKHKIVKFYLKNTQYINNWDLVDLSCEYILGKWLLDKNRGVLYSLAESKSVWERRIAIVTSFEFIRNYQFDDTLKIATMLLNDKHDLIYKAVGWMLREVGKKDQKLLEDFLDKHSITMPRTMLRYAIEKLDRKKKEKYLR